MSSIVLKITRDGESSFSACRLVGDNADPNLSAWYTVRAEIINGKKAVKSGYLHIIAGPEEWVCTSGCIFNLNDNDFLFSVQDESANTDYPTAYLLHYEFDWEELTEQKQTKLDIVWCSSNYIIDYTGGYQAYRANVRKNIIEAICKYEEKRKNRANPRHT